MNNSLKFTDPTGNIWGLFRGLNEGVNWLEQRANGNSGYQYNTNYVSTGQLPNDWRNNPNVATGPNGYPIGPYGEYNAYGEYGNYNIDIEMPADYRRELWGYWYSYAKMGNQTTKPKRGDPIYEWVPNEKDGTYQYIGNQDRAYTMKEFISANRGSTRQQIINQLENRGNTLFHSQPGGPFMRYVVNPRDGRVVDMRHVLIVGKYPSAIGNLLEIGQWIIGQKSGMNSQDFYSNGVGYQFYMQYNWLQDFIAPNTFTDQLNQFFYRSRITINY